MTFNQVFNADQDKNAFDIFWLKSEKYLEIYFNRECYLKESLLIEKKLPLEVLLFCEKVSLKGQILKIPLSCCTQKLNYNLTYDYDFEVDAMTIYLYEQTILSHTKTIAVDEDITMIFDSLESEQNEKRIGFIEILFCSEILGLITV